MKQTILFLVTVLISSIGFSQTKIDKNSFGDLRARSLGPAVMGGRIAAIDAVNSDPRTVYIGTAGGGIWKSKNEGTTFKPVFKKTFRPSEPLPSTKNIPIRFGLEPVSPGQETLLR